MYSTTPSPPSPEPASAHEVGARLPEALPASRLRPPMPLRAPGLPTSSCPVLPGTAPASGETAQLSASVPHAPGVPLPPGMRSARASHPALPRAPVVGPPRGGSSCAPSEGSSTAGGSSSSTAPRPIFGRRAGGSLNAPPGVRTPQAAEPQVRGRAGSLNAPVGRRTPSADAPRDSGAPSETSGASGRVSVLDALAASIPLSAALPETLGRSPARGGESLLRVLEDSNRKHRGGSQGPPPRRTGSPPPPPSGGGRSSPAHSPRSSLASLASALAQQSPDHQIQPDRGVKGSGGGGGSLVGNGAPSEGLTPCWSASPPERTTPGSLSMPPRAAGDAALAAAAASSSRALAASAATETGQPEEVGLSDRPAPRRLPHNFTITKAARSMEQALKSPGGGEQRQDSSEPGPRVPPMLRAAQAGGRVGRSPRLSGSPRGLNAHKEAPVSRASAAALASEFLAQVDQYQGYLGELKIMSDAIARSPSPDSMPGSKPGTPPRNWRATYQSSARGDRTDTGSYSNNGTPPRNWRSSLPSQAQGVGASGPPSNNGTPTRNWRNVQQQPATSTAKPSNTPPRNWRHTSKELAAQPPGAQNTSPSWQKVPHSTYRPRPTGPSTAPAEAAAKRPSLGGDEPEVSPIESLIEKGFLAANQQAWNLDPSLAPNDLAHVQALFLAQAPGQEVIAVHRVENSGLSFVYDAVRNTMDAKDESILWHGTSPDSVRNIVLNGFNRAYCGRHGTRLGHGSYFSSRADYSMRFCDRRRPRRMMFLSKVLVGAWTKGSPDLVEAPHRDADGLKRYDSVVDDPEKPGIFCVFRDFQALPLYLVEFTASQAADGHEADASRDAQHAAFLAPGAQSVRPVG